MNGLYHFSCVPMEQFLALVVSLVSTTNCGGYGDERLTIRFEKNSYQLEFVAGSTSEPCDSKSDVQTGIDSNQWCEFEVRADGDAIKLCVNDVEKADLSNKNRPSFLG